MRKEILTYLKQRPNTAVLCLMLVALAGFCILFFKPYRIYDWVQQQEVTLFWAELGLLAVIIGVLIHHMSLLRDALAQSKLQGEVTNPTEMFNFYDERGDLKLSVKTENLFYLEAADNYVVIHYQNVGKVQTLLIRNSLKNIEWRFRDTSLKRCHRSYLVNLKMVQMVKRVDGDVYLDFNDEKIAAIPVGKAYADQVVAHFAQ